MKLWRTSRGVGLVCTVLVQYTKKSPDYLSLQWTDPKIGMRENVSYHFSYDLESGKAGNSNILHKKLCVGF